MRKKIREDPTWKKKNYQGELDEEEDKGGLHEEDGRKVRCERWKESRMRKMDGKSDEKEDESRMILNI